MKPWALFLCLAGACAQQEPALLVQIGGAYRIPADADKLSLDVLDGATVIEHEDFCATASPGCAALPPQPALAQSITLVESGAAHPGVKVNAALYLGAAVVGLGSATASFDAGQTVDVSVVVTPPQ